MIGGCETVYPPLRMYLCEACASCETFDGVDNWRSICIDCEDLLAYLARVIEEPSSGDQFWVLLREGDLYDTTRH